MTSSKTIDAPQNLSVTGNGLTSEQARVVLQFLQRTQLQGSEMAAYVDVFNALSSVAQTTSSDSEVVT